jgi:pimeloyl-ACP methyl ester carboxylesterase
VLDVIEKTYTIGEPPLVLLPGTLCDERVFGPALKKLPATTFLAPDWHGMNSTAQVAENLLSALPSRFAIAGFSLGAIVALEMAARAPERIAGLALINATARDVPLDRFAERRLAAVSVQSNRHHVEKELWDSYVAPHRLDDAALKAVIGDMAQDSPEDALVRQTEIALSRVDSRERLPQIAVPCTVIGGAEDRVAPPYLQEEIAGLLPDAVLEIIPGAGHFALLEDPAACARALSAWLARVQAFSAGKSRQ